MNKGLPSALKLAEKEESDLGSDHRPPICLTDESTQFDDLTQFHHRPFTPLAVLRSFVLRSQWDIGDIHTVS